MKNNKPIFIVVAIIVLVIVGAMLFDKKGSSQSLVDAQKNQFPMVYHNNLFNKKII